MDRRLLIGMALTLVTSCSRPNVVDGSETAAKESAVTVLYTVSNELGYRTARSRENVLATRTMSAEQLREWAADASAIREGRSLWLYQAGHVEGVHRDAAGRLLYSVRDRAGTRTGPIRADVLATVKRSAEQIREWAAASRERTASVEGRRGTAQVTVRTPRGALAIRNARSLPKASEMTAEQMREWAEAKEGKAEGRAALIYQSGYAEEITRDAAGALRYMVRTEQGHRSSGVRDSVLGTLKMREDEVRAWATASNEKAARERRSATFPRSGYVEVIWRGLPGDEPPLPR